MDPSSSATSFLSRRTSKARPELWSGERTKDGGEAPTGVSARSTDLVYEKGQKTLADGTVKSLKKMLKEGIKETPVMDFGYQLVESARDLD